MRILVACEYSRRVSNAFEAMGHFAMSCDFEPAEDGSDNHYQGDVRDVINDGWDLMIGHPPCDFLTGAAEWAYSDNPMINGKARKMKPGTLFGEERRKARNEASDFFMMLANANIPKICIENPVGVMSSRYRKPDQVIQPYNFGEDASKKTCLWLKGLQKLIPTSRFNGRMVLHNGKMVERWSNQTDSGQNRLPPSDDRWKDRSRTYLGIASAMATQWG